MSKSVKSQVTIFLILGIIMVIIFTVLILVSNYSVKEATAPETSIAKKIPLELQPIKKFVDDCLNVVSKQGLKKLGKQGGYLFVSQGGTVVDYEDTFDGKIFVKLDEGTKVVYNILKPRFEIGFFFPGPGEYPWINFPYNIDGPPDTTLTPQFKGQNAFGTNTLPFLKKPNPHSVQLQLESYIRKPYDGKNNIDRCLNDFSVFEEQGFEIKAKNENINEPDFVGDVIVDINENDVVFNMEYPLIIKNLGTGEITEIKDFFVKHEIKLGKLHEFVNDLIEEDISDIKFDIERDINSLSGFKDGFIVDVQRNIPIGANPSNDDLITVTDEKSLLDGVPYQYSFMRKNRNPALHFIPDYWCGPDYTTKSGGYYDENIGCGPKSNNRLDAWKECSDATGICTCEWNGDPFIIKEDMFNKEAYDPDKDSLDFSFEEDFLSEEKTISFNPPLPSTLPSQIVSDSGKEEEIVVIVKDSSSEDFQTVIFHLIWEHKSHLDRTIAGCP